MQLAQKMKWRLLIWKQSGAVLSGAALIAKEVPEPKAGPAKAVKGIAIYPYGSETILSVFVVNFTYMEQHFQRGKCISEGANLAHSRAKKKTTTTEDCFSPYFFDWFVR